MLAEVDANEDARSGRKVKLNRQTQNRFEAAVYMLKKESEVLFVAHKLKGGNPIWYYFLLAMGVIAISLSLTWLIHICIFILPNPGLNPFLNNLFVGLQTGIPGFPLFGIVTFAIYCLYLLWCCIKGAFRFGLKIPYFCKIYPMEVGNTYLNGFLANSWIILVCSVPCVSFCASAFPVYSRNTAFNNLFGSQIRYAGRGRWCRSPCVCFCFCFCFFLSFIIIFLASFSCMH